MSPADCRFSRTHEWVRLESGLAVIGISQFAVQQLTDLVYVQLPQVERTLAAGEAFGEVESVKAVSDLYAPIAGTVVEVNQPLTDQLQWLSEDPFGKGWILKLRPADASHVNALMSAAEYDQFCRTAGH
jgi:glycine cleavage system H protein